jgi:hypothetical protein
MREAADAPTDADVLLYRIRVLRLAAREMQIEMARGRRRAARVRLASAIVVRQEAERAERAERAHGAEPVPVAELAAVAAAAEPVAVANLIDMDVELELEPEPESESYEAYTPYRV